MNTLREERKRDSGVTVAGATAASFRSSCVKSMGSNLQTTFAVSESLLIFVVHSHFS